MMTCGEAKSVIIIALKKEPIKHPLGSLFILSLSWTFHSRCRPINSAGRDLKTANYES